MGFDFRLLYMKPNEYKKKVLEKDEYWDTKMDTKKMERDLKGLKPDDPKRESYLKALKNNAELDEIRERTKTSKKDGFWKIVSSIATIGLSAFGLSKAYAIDRSDEIVKNKTTQGYFHKVFKL